jgi:hypothetical protein
LPYRLWVCHVFCSLHSAFVTVAYPVLQVTSFISLHYSPVTSVSLLPLGAISLHSFQPLSVHRLPTFQLACIVVRASSIFVFSCNKNALVLSIVRHAFWLSPSGGNVGGFLPRLQHSLHPLSYLKLPCCTPSLHSQVARRTSDCKSFISFAAPCRMHLSSFIFCNRFPNARSRLFYPLRSN